MEGLGNRKPIVVLDACSIINILRIDSDNYLSDLLFRIWTINIAQKVYDEATTNIKRNQLDEESGSRIDKVLPTFLPTVKKDDEIKRDLGHLYDELIDFSKHTKKENGELLSTALTCSLSRNYNEKITFYTDDFPAKEEFRHYFENQQIGYIEDSVDLLMSLYVSAHDFTLPLLKDYLSKLKCEYSTTLTNLVKDVEKLYNSLTSKDKKDRNLSLNAENILYGYYHNHSDMFKGISYFYNNKKYKNFYETIRKYYDLLPFNISDKPNIITKIDNLTSYLNKYTVFKIC